MRVQTNLSKYVNKRFDLHTAKASGEIDQRYSAEEIEERNEIKDVCLNCKKKKCSGTDKCFKKEKEKKNGTGM